MAFYSSQSQGHILTSHTWSYTLGPFANSGFSPAPLTLPQSPTTTPTSSLTDFIVCLPHFPLLGKAQGVRNTFFYFFLLCLLLYPQHLKEYLCIVGTQYQLNWVNALTHTYVCIHFSNICWVCTQWQLVKLELHSARQAQHGVCP